MSQRTALASALIVLTLLAAACSEPAKTGGSGSKSSTTIGRAATRCQESSSVVACAPAGSTLASYLPKKPEKAQGAPVLIGTINQDTGAAGAFPELTVADKVAVEFINTELGGVDGHPIRLIACDTNFSPDRSQSCAQEMVSRKVAAVIGGIDVWGTGIKTLENNGIPYVGGIPVSFEAARSKVSFQFSGGTWGGVLGMGKYAIDKRAARRIAIIYCDFGPITNSAKLGQKALQKLGAKVTLVSVSPVNADMVTGLNQAAQSKPDAILALTGDTGCKPTMLTAKQIGLKVPIFYTGACAAPKILDGVGGAAEGSIFNLEADNDPHNADNVLYRAIAQRYGAKYKYEWQSAGTVSFRATMNLYMVLRRVGVDKITPASILAQFRKARDVPSFAGHPYTCDGRQLAGYPAMCAPQQSLGVVRNGELTPLTGWIDVGKLVD